MSRPSFRRTYQGMIDRGTPANINNLKDDFIDDQLPILSRTDIELSDIPLSQFISSSAAQIGDRAERQRQIRVDEFNAPPLSRTGALNPLEFSLTQETFGRQAPETTTRGAKERVTGARNRFENLKRQQQQEKQKAQSKKDAALSGVLGKVVKSRPKGGFAAPKMNVEQKMRLKLRLRKAKAQSKQ